MSDRERHKRYCVPAMTKNMGSMGRGLIASKEFKKGDRILKDKSVVSYKADEFDYSSRTQIEELMKLVTNLKREDREDYFNLSMNPLEREKIPEYLFSPARRRRICDCMVHLHKQQYLGRCLSDVVLIESLLRP